MPSTTLPSFHPNGQVSRQGTCQNGERDRTRTTFDSQGRIITIEFWKAGNPHGSWMTFHADEHTPEGETGPPASKVIDVEGRPDGTARWWRAGGTLGSEVEYSDGESLQTRYYDEDGQLSKRCTSTPGFDL